MILPGCGRSWVKSHSLWLPDKSIYIINPEWVKAQIEQYFLSDIDTASQPKHLSEMWRKNLSVVAIDHLRKTGQYADVDKETAFQVIHPMLIPA